MITKICSKCRKKLLIDEFSKRKSGLDSWCKKCRREYQYEYNREYRETERRKREYENKKYQKIDNSIIGELERICNSKKHYKEFNNEYYRIKKAKENYQKNFLTIRPTSFHINNGGYKILYFNRYSRLEHLWIMEKYLGRLLYPWEQVHHKNRNRLDNRIENLEIRPHSGDDHTRMIITRLTNENQKLKEKIKELENS